MLRDRLNAVEERIARAVARAGRQRSDVTLIAVTKKFPASVTMDAYELGLRHFGENYVQEFEAKHAAVAHLSGAAFHLIGHLQSNKTRVAAALFQSIQTVDSEKLARRLQESLDAARPPSHVMIDVMIEVKLSTEESKAGAAPDAVPALVEAIGALPRLRLQGLMTMPPWSDDPEETRPYFRKLAALARAVNLPALSMGMSHDFEAAIEEGATHIRVGTALFGARPKPEAAS